MMDFDTARYLIRLGYLEQNLFYSLAAVPSVVGSDKPMKKPHFTYETEQGVYFFTETSYNELCHRLGLMRDKLHESRVRRSPNIQDALENKLSTSYFKKVAACADATIRGGSADIVEGMRTLAFIEPGPVVWVAQASSRTFLFKGFEQDIVQKLEALPDKKVTKSPKILMKMLSHRITTLVSLVNGMNESRREHHRKHQNTGHVLLAPEFWCETPEDLQVWLRQLMDFKLSHPSIRELQTFLFREDIPNELFRQAILEANVKAVHES